MGNWRDPATHLTAEFGVSFPTWQSFRRYIEQAASPPEVDADRILHQVLAADFAQRLATVEEHDWVLLGSLTLPARPVEVKWPALPTPTPIDPAYVVARAAFDLDLSARDLNDLDPDQAARLFDSTVGRLLAQVASDNPDPGTPHGLGLGGLVRYSLAHRVTRPDGTNMGVIVAQPRETHLGPNTTFIVDDPISIEFDIKPPVKVGFDGPSQDSLRSIVAVRIPGMLPYTPALLPTHYQLAAKICMLSGPPSTSRNVGTEPWHRYKDLFDCYYMIRNCRFEAGVMRQAIRSNQNLARFGVTDLPHPYRLYPGTAADKPIPWHEGVERLRSTHPELRNYPELPELARTIANFVDAMRESAPTAVWQNDRWLSQDQASRATSIPELTARPAAAVQTYAPSQDEGLLDTLRTAGAAHTAGWRPDASHEYEQPESPDTGYDTSAEPGPSAGL